MSVELNVNFADDSPTNSRLGPDDRKCGPYDADDEPRNGDRVRQLLIPRDKGCRQHSDDHHANQQSSEPDHAYNDSEEAQPQWA